MNKRFQLALIDLDGTLWRGGTVIPGAPEFVLRLRDSGIRPVFFTNNSTRTPEEVVYALENCKIRAEAEEVCTSAQAAAHVLHSKIKAGSIVTYVGGSGLQTALEAERFDARRAKESELHSTWLGDAQGAVVGMDVTVSYMDLAVVCRVAHRLGWFVLTNPDVRLPVEDGFLPGNGSLGALVATASGTKPIVTGKPDATFVDFALERYGVAREDAVIIGDNLYTDILAGNHADVYSILVKTGVTLPGDDDHIHPNEIVESVDNIFRQESR
ncbi:HAD-IIA family hydrolase [Alicyclobacillus dauci]|uniref:Acid sugar phosphatase n=1 Tax=Alicyclobacillus dauci TaxID=1475485 RepID=A0ABY6Z9A1_9BACL|nr:HAD-IIA family hydrolase [Alicyclobacillus dauci]WAH38834.1 HAD-IIA family hydrolase [Alicyclobacillus dauci]